MIRVTQALLDDAVLDLTSELEDAVAPAEPFGHQLAVALRRARGLREPRPRRGSSSFSTSSEGRIL